MTNLSNSHVNKIPGVSMDDDGFIRTIYGRYHPVTGEGLNFVIPESLWNEILNALIQDGLDSGIAEDFDIDAWFEEKFSGE
jgi:hypothetical protein